MFEKPPIPVVDIFAGPGGLGEGFSSLENGNAFKIHVSAEMEASAHQTLVLRSFYRILKRRGGDALDCYYQFCNGLSPLPWDENSGWAWQEAEREARCITLGTTVGNRELNSTLNESGIGPSEPWVLIGGPPCQAYSLVGRARNRGISDYRAEDDRRHFLYKEYLKIIRGYQPAVFVMENVKGILSSKIDEKWIFHTILNDLAKGGSRKPSGHGYKIHSLVLPTVFDQHMRPDEIEVNDFIIRAENYGIPQARHRVILLGIREDIQRTPDQLNEADPVTVAEVLSNLPPLRSRISKQVDSPEHWATLVKHQLDELVQETIGRVNLADLSKALKAARRSIGNYPDSGSLRMAREAYAASALVPLDSWYRDERLQVWLNHEARSHMATDLRRYLFAAAYAKAFGNSPKGHQAFDLTGLRPAHKNWESGKFADRFRVQMADRPATTVTSHIAKDGHYFIHPDPAQCRSLTVREAARLQTFPDNYFFQGNRTQQFHQVGNAVPPLLAQKIARVVRAIFPK